MRRRAPGRDQHPDESSPARTRFVKDWPARCLADFEAQIETLARQIAEDSIDPARLALAGTASEAELELSQVRASEKGKMIERSLIFGALESPSHSRSDLEEIRWQLAEFEWLKTLAEASPFCRSWLIFPQLYPTTTLSLHDSRPR
jgi:hypothetical protein